MNGKRVFVSGGAGVIGREIVPRLVARGATVLVGDLKPRPAEFPPAVIYRTGDLNAMSAAEIASFAPDTFIHLAATFERSTESYEFWEENFLHNVRLSHHLMTLAKDLPSLRRVVFASSYLIYDPSLYQFDHAQAAPVSLKESDPVQPRNLTGMAKFAHEIELRFIESFCGDRISIACPRIYRGYGRNSRDVISRWVRSLLKGEPITVYRPEGLFDYIYAADTAEGLIRLAETPSAKGLVNLGTGRSRRVQDVVDVLRQHFPGMQATAAESDIPFEASQADLTEFGRHIDWRPAYDLEQAIPEIVAFERARLDAAADKPAALNVLVSSASGKVPLVRAMQRAVRQIDPQGRVIAGDIDPGAVSFQVADGSWLMPRSNDASLDAIVAGLRERGIRCVLPTRDGELAFWSRHAARFKAEGVEVIVASPDALQVCLDKLAFARFGARHQLPFIATGERLEDIDATRLVVKERHGAGSRSIGLDLDRTAAASHAGTLEHPIFQPFVRGREISVDAWLGRDQRVKGLVLRTRDRVVNGESQVTTTFSDARIEALATRVLETLGLSGPVVMQGLIGEDDGFSVIECNPRFGGASTTGIAAGLDSLHWSLLEAIGADLATWPFHRIAGQIRQVRVPQDIHLHDPDL